MINVDATVLFNELGKYIRGEIPDLSSFEGNKEAAVRLSDREIDGRIPTARVDQLLFDIAVSSRTPERRERSAEVLSWLNEWLPEKRIHHWLDLTLRASEEKHSFAYGIFKTLPERSNHLEDPLCQMLENLKYFEEKKVSHGLLVALFSKPEEFHNNWFKHALKRCFEEESKEPGSHLTKEAIDEFKLSNNTHEILAISISAGLEPKEFLKFQIPLELKEEIIAFQKAFDINKEAMAVLGEIYTPESNTQKKSSLNELQASFSGTLGLT